MTRFLPPIFTGILATVLLFMFGLFLSAGGHNFALLMVFFPWAMMLGGISSQLAWSLPFLLLVALQFPIYGIVFGLGHGRRSLFWAVLGLVALIHVLGVVWCFVFDPSES